ncbi:hypothetical protein F4782DRAFT_511575 [Xylaria castorea]|nr:hypothetical protein F4782DRAFT_511575 [Xylaria castorea]
MLILLQPKTLLGYIMTPQCKDARYPGPVNSNRTATALDFPEQSIPYVQNEREIPERNRQEVPNANAAQSKGTSIEVPDDESEQKTKSVRRNCSIQFAEDAQHDGSGPAKGNAPARMDRHCTEHRDARKRHRSPYPTREPKTRQKAVPIPIPVPVPVPVSNKKDVRRDVSRLENDAISWVDDIDDKYGDNNDDNDDSGQDVAIESNPLANYPRIGQSLTHPKRRIEVGGAHTSLLTEGLRRYAQICEDIAFAERVQRAVECQGKLSRRQKSKLQQLREEGEKTRMPLFRKPDGQDWGFDMADPGCDGTTVFGEAVVPVYHSREDDSQA